MKLYLISTFKNIYQNSYSCNYQRIYLDNETVIKMAQSASKMKCFTESDTALQYAKANTLHHKGKWTPNTFQKDSYSVLSYVIEVNDDKCKLNEKNELIEDLNGNKEEIELEELDSDESVKTKFKYKQEKQKLGQETFLYYNVDVKNLDMSKAEVYKEKDKQEEENKTCFFM